MFEVKPAHLTLPFNMDFATCWVCTAWQVGLYFQNGACVWCIYIYISDFPSFNAMNIILLTLYHKVLPVPCRTPRAGLVGPYGSLFIHWAPVIADWSPLGAITVDDLSQPSTRFIHHAKLEHCHSVRNFRQVPQNPQWQKGKQNVANRFGRS